MKIAMRRRHVTRPEDYESVELQATIEVDSEVDTDFDWDEDPEVIGDELSDRLDALLDKDVCRALGLDGTYTSDSHLWVFYEKDGNN